MKFDCDHRCWSISSIKMTSCLGKKFFLSTNISFLIFLQICIKCDIYLRKTNLLSMIHYPKIHRQRGILSIIKHKFTFGAVFDSLFIFILNKKNNNSYFNNFFRDFNDVSICLFVTWGLLNSLISDRQLKRLRESNFLVLFIFSF